MTRKEYSIGGLRTVMTSPTRMTREGLTVTPAIDIRPFLQASVAIERVLNTRTAQSHLSTRTSSIYSISNLIYSANVHNY